ncbi:MAG: hypothetical protein ACJ8AW_00530, partial [Rhodopila sp.]
MVVRRRQWWWHRARSGGADLQRQPAVSSKHVRLPTRGMLGNGTRIVAGFCAIERLPIMVESRDRQTVLRVERATGHTIIERQEPIAPITG